MVHPSFSSYSLCHQPLTPPGALNAPPSSWVPSTPVLMSHSQLQQRRKKRMWRMGGWGRGGGSPFALQRSVSQGPEANKSREGDCMNCARTLCMMLHTLMSSVAVIRILVSRFSIVFLCLTFSLFLTCALVYKSQKKLYYGGRNLLYVSFTIRKGCFCAPKVFSTLECFLHLLPYI